ncbi:MAG: hypothetical protein SFW36_12585 [Leptolyngbyaceae cyanobacterium bins.59]|nr:hypothetical protein [Leptolyngbyaceae cyanobacterium bins.59]
MVGQMCWLGVTGSNSEKVLHLRKTPFDPWLPYTAFPYLQVPDYKIPGGSKGWSTYQKLRQAGWALIPTAEANIHAVTPHLKSA